MDSSKPEIAPAASPRASNVLHLAPPDAGHLARLILPMLAASAGADAPGLRLLVLTADDETAVALARATAREFGGGATPLVALTGAGRARRVLSSAVPGAAAIPIGVAAALVSQSVLPLTNVRHFVLALPGSAGAGPGNSLDAVMAELPKTASRTLVTARETPAIVALVERLFFKAVHVRDEAPTAARTFTGELQILATTDGARWEIIRRVLDQFDPPSAAILTADAAQQAEAERELAAIGYTPTGPVVASRGDIEHGTSLVIVLGVPDATALLRATAAAPGNLIIACAPTEIADVRALAGATPVRAISLDGPRVRAASREAATRARLREILASGEYALELHAITPLLDEFDGAEIAAAALTMASEAARQSTAAAAPPPAAPRPTAPRRFEERKGASRFEERKGPSRSDDRKGSGRFEERKGPGRFDERKGSSRFEERKTARFDEKRTGRFDDRKKR